MKKLFLFLLISIFLISLVSAWEYDAENDYKDAYAYAKITGMYPACEGNQNGKYCAGTWYVDVSHEGDKFFIAYKASDWFECTWKPNYEGYEGMQLIQDGRKYLNENGLVPKYILCAWDYDYISPSEYTGIAKCGGYLGDYFSRYNVECSLNTDCDSGEICDKSGDWTTWRCKTDPCKYVTCADYCQNSIRYHSGYCSGGECNYQTETCTHGCSGEFCAEDPCMGVICDDKCENSIWFYDGHCVNGKCVYDSQDTCQYGCQNEPSLMLAMVVGEGMCKTTPCEGVTCEDYCSENSLFHSGKCIGGKCTQFKEKLYAEECGFVSLWKRWYVWVGGVIFISLIALSIWWYRRRR